MNAGTAYAQIGLNGAIQLAIERESKKSFVDGMINQDYYPGITINGEDISPPLLNQWAIQVQMLL
jgi:hypothetical protein